MLPAPRTSVVIPAYNHERFIGEALASVQAQTVDDFEVVVIDDGSSDGTAEVAQAQARLDPRIRVLRQANGGSHAAINRGLAEARGQWIAILNSDDRYAPTRLARLLETTADGARFVVSDTRLIDEQGAPILDTEHWWHRTLADFLARVDTVGPIEGLMYGNFTVSTSNFFFARSLSDEVGPFRPLRRVIDWDWALRAALHDPQSFRHLRGEPLLDYRLHGSNAILGDPLRGTLEINRVQRHVLKTLAVPDSMLASMQRNRRELRRAWRDRHVARVEQFVRDREAQVAALYDEMRDRDAQIATLLAEQTTLLAEITKNIAQIHAQTAVSVALRTRLDKIEQSLPWRLLRTLKQLARRGSG